MIFLPAFLHPFTPDDLAHQSYNNGLIRALNRYERHAFTYSFEYFDYARHSTDEEFFKNMASYLKTKYRLHTWSLCLNMSQVSTDVQRFEVCHAGLHRKDAAIRQNVTKPKCPECAAAFSHPAKCPNPWPAALCTLVNA